MGGKKKGGGGNGPDVVAIILDRSCAQLLAIALALALGGVSPIAPKKGKVKGGKGGKSSGVGKGGKGGGAGKGGIVVKGSKGGVVPGGGGSPKKGGKK